MRLPQLDAAAKALGLRVRGGLHPGPGDAASEGTQTVLLLGPDEPRFWDVFTASEEYRDGGPNRLDRWSKRVIGTLAQAWGGIAIFPYDGPPYAPFLRWAEASGQCHVAPVGLLVHNKAGLLISFRGAIALPQRLELPAAGASPCDTCATRACETACPVSALVPGAPYDVPRCQAYLRSPEGRQDCRTGGCRVRNACPVSKGMQRPAAQSAFHMAAFVKD